MTPKPQDGSLNPSEALELRLLLLEAKLTASFKHELGEMAGDTADSLESVRKELTKLREYSIRHHEKIRSLEVRRRPFGGLLAFLVKVGGFFTSPL